MKVIKELPLSLFYSLKYSITPASFFLKNSKPSVPIIISLTSIPSRFSTLNFVIKSILNQNTLPKKIVLWINEDMKNKLPMKVKKMESDIFEIRFSPLHCSHKKLIHTLETFSKDCIVTCDDDLMYRKEWLSKIYNQHLLDPKSIIGVKTSHINFDDKNNSLPFKKWRSQYITNKNPKAFVPIGAWGILYPPRSLHKEVLNVQKLLELAPKADDLWFKAMSLLNKTISIQAKDTPKEPIPIIGTQKFALKKDNLAKDKNTEQWLSLDKEYNLNEIVLSK
ncbi:glycosyltransferase [Maribacter sp. 1_MG-2023]|uniref:glycosyltransferase n=1 Tax=Maribacter sp. 1_MG-2023 TaxID=3062677 RepID=UPI0026E1B469|nr:glycosyltransferase [Maribacter sp. 1_MG-2023]MDO6470557.1 glycosyltransferase [Maribacter sp. 1_MG-2023]